VAFARRKESYAGGRRIQDIESELILASILGMQDDEKASGDNMYHSLSHHNKSKPRSLLGSLLRLERLLETSRRSRRSRRKAVARENERWFVEYRRVPWISVPRFRVSSPGSAIVEVGDA
jgi:hypothetical protein